MATVEQEEPDVSTLNPYLNFRGQAREAMEFYQTVFGGQLTASSFADFGMPGVPEGEENNIMHAQLTTDSGFTLMGSDVPSSMELSEGGSISVSLSGSEDDELRGYWDRLCDGANVNMPLTAAPWGDTFGELTDRYGVKWLMNIAGQSGAAGAPEAESTASTGTEGDAAPEEI